MAKLLHANAIDFNDWLLMAGTAEIEAAKADDFSLSYVYSFSLQVLRFKVLPFFLRAPFLGSDCSVAARSSNTATCAIAALSVPIPSGVFALIPTWFGFTPSNSATRAWIFFACGTILGSAKIRLESILEILYPARRTCLRASSRKMTESAPFHFGSLGGK